MNIVDIVIIIIFIGTFIKGYQTGLIRQLVNLFGFFIALFFAYRFSSELSPYLQGIISMPTFNNSTIEMFSQTFQLQNMFYNAIAFFLIFVATKIALNISGAILHQIASLPGLKVVNRFSGALIGLAQGILIVIISLHVIKIMPWEQINSYIDASTISSFFIDITPLITEMLYNLWNNNIL